MAQPTTRAPAAPSQAGTPQDPFDYAPYYAPQPLPPRARPATADRSAIEVMFAYYTAE